MQRFWWLNLVRGIVALIIAMLILGWPESVHQIFVNFLALYWFSGGLLTLRWGLSTHQTTRWWRINGLLELTVGAAILLRGLYQDDFAPGLVIRIFGLVACCVGVVRVVDSSLIRNTTHEQFLSNLLLGLFEVGLGGLLIFFDVLEPWTKLLAGGWALTGGIVLILQSFQQRRAKRIHSSSA